MAAYLAALARRPTIVGSVRIAIDQLGPSRGSLKLGLKLNQSSKSASRASRLSATGAVVECAHDEPGGPPH